MTDLLYTVAAISNKLGRKVLPTLRWWEPIQQPISVVLLVDDLLVGDLRVDDVGIGDHPANPDHAHRHRLGGDNRWKTANWQELR